MQGRERCRGCGVQGQTRPAGDGRLATRCPPPDAGPWLCPPSQAAHSHPQDHPQEREDRRMSKGSSMTPSPSIRPFRRFPMFIVFDLDGTLALNEHRQHYVERPVGEKDWRGFFAACDKDVPNTPVIRTLLAFDAIGDRVEIW